jgi:hypothetical protein
MKTGWWQAPGDAGMEGKTSNLNIESRKRESPLNNE